LVTRTFLEKEEVWEGEGKRGAEKAGGRIERED